MRTLLAIVGLLTVLLANWPAATVQCQAMTENVWVVSGENAKVRRGREWLVVLAPDGHETATVSIYDNGSHRVIAEFTARVGSDGRMVVPVTIDQRFDGVKDCWMWVLGK